jgi:DNA mismatch endonuclease (patch repair protein)
VNKDRLNQAERSRNMSRIRSKDTKPEKIVRSLLHRLGYRFRLHVRIPLTANRAKDKTVDPRETRLKASPAAEFKQKRRAASVDILLPKHKTAIFVHGCFWHRHKRCKNCTTPTHRRDWWLAKLNGNAARDRLNQRALRKLGWRVIVIWECESDQPDSLAATLNNFHRRW